MPPVTPSRTRVRSEVLMAGHYRAWRGRGKQRLGMSQCPLVQSSPFTTENPAAPVVCALHTVTVSTDGSPYVDPRLAARRAPPRKIAGARFGGPLRSGAARHPDSQGSARRERSRRGAFGAQGVPLTARLVE